ncbi:MAG: LytR family transcriptional regulator, partial [Solirubrobacterales bacterium]|nr:LytR family transcriptional regulator [Solirubrobacterales bacterium]
MTSLPLALSLSNTFTKIGAVAAFAALLAIAILSLLVFSQARELKRLREWAGRAPERAADLEARVSAAAAARVGQSGQVARPVQRATPVNARPGVPAAAATQGEDGVPGAPVAVPSGEPLSAGAPAATAPNSTAPAA